MSRSLNKVMLIGNVGNDPRSGRLRRVREWRSFPWRRTAPGPTFRSAAGEDRVAPADLFGRLVDVVERWVKKGDRLYVEGRIEYSQTEGEGGTKYWTDIVVNEMVMLGRPRRRGRRRRGWRTQRRGGVQPPATETDDDLPF